MAIEAIARSSHPQRTTALRRIALAAAAGLLLAATAARADNPALQGPSVLAPYRFNPPTQPVSPLEEQKAQQYRFQLQRQIFDYDRSGGPLTPLQDQQLRDSRRELDRMNQILLPPR